MLIPSVNGADDASIVYHEYAHGLNGRLVINPKGWSALGLRQSRAIDEGVIAGREIVQRGDVLRGHDEDVQRRLRIDVAKGHKRVVSMHDGGRNRPGHDPAEETVGVRHI